MENHWSALFTQESDVRKFEDYIYTAIENVRKINLKPQNFEDRIDDGRYYNVGSLAVAHIASLAGEASLVEYYYQRPQHRDWQDNFREVFGIAVGAFYGLFEEYRSDVAPPLPRFRGMVLRPDGELVEAVRIFAYPPSGGSSSMIELGPEGYFDGVAPDGSGPHVLSLDFLPGDGSVCHLGWYDGRGGVTTVYDERAEPFPDGLDIIIRLPATPSGLCSRIVGIATRVDGSPLEGLWVAIHGRGASSGTNIGAATAADGTFTIGARDGTYALVIHSGTVGACSVLGYAGSGKSEEGMKVQGEDVTGIRLSVTETRHQEPSWITCVIVQ